jgi:hypothetical protein
MSMEPSSPFALGASETRLSMREGGNQLTSVWFIASTAWSGGNAVTDVISASIQMLLGNVGRSTRR